MMQSSTTMKPLPRYATIADVGRILGGRSRASIYRDIADGRLPQPGKFGRRTLWDADKLLEFLRANIDAR
jgi:predicted DNA-binding transcriptional regulator AlpA